MVTSVDIAVVIVYEKCSNDVCECPKLSSPTRVRKTSLLPPSLHGRRRRLFIGST